jgi:hypothetical protein
VDTRARGALRLGRLQGLQTLLPFPLKAARHESVLGIDGAIAAFGARDFVARSFHAETPLLECRIAIGGELLGGGESSGERGRLQSRDEGLCHSLVDLNASDVEAIDAASFDENLAGAMITGSGIASTVVRVQTTTAMTAARSLSEKYV